MMATLFTANLDLAIAGALIIIAVILFILYKMSILPQKSLPFVAVAIAGVFGVTLFRSWLLNKQVNDLKKRDDEMKKKEKELLTIQKKSEQKELDLQIALKKLEDERSAYERAIAEISRKTAEERKELANKTREEISDEVWKRINGK